MCLAQPLNKLTTTYWFILDAVKQVEKLMEEVFDEKELWKEGDYLIYMELLNLMWGNLKHFIDASFGLTTTINKVKKVWYVCPPNEETFAWYKAIQNFVPEIQSYYNTAQQVDKTFEEISARNIPALSMYCYFIKCCSRYNTRKFIKKLKLPRRMDEIRNRNLMDSICDAQKLMWVGEREKGWMEFTSDDGKKRYVWQQQTTPQGANHMCWEMEYIEY
tara:strand:+ start:156 stop:809 length:654 start_codon:yes stop_codon:yes gene_type:complete